MAEEAVASSTVRSDMVDIAAGFLQSPHVANEAMHRKRAFLRQKGLTDTEINHAFERIPARDTTVEAAPSQPPSFLARLLRDFAIAGLLAFLIKLIKRSLYAKPTNDLSPTLAALQQSILEMQTSIAKLEQASSLLDVKIRATNGNQASSTSIDQIKQDVQALKEAFLNRSQFSVPQAIVLPKTTGTDSDNDGIDVLPEPDKKSDDENA